MELNISSLFLAPFHQLYLNGSHSKATHPSIAFVSVADIRAKKRSSLPSARPPPPKELVINNDKKDEAPPPSLEQAAHRPVRGPNYKTTSVPAKVRQPPSVHAMLCNVLDDLINKFLEPQPLRPSVNPKDILSGNYAPVGELPPTKCTVEGQLPSCLSGAYIRNGPNPRFMPRAAYHLFDGDGMLHAVHISGEHATFCSRFVRTYKLSKEEEVGSAVYPNFFALEGMSGLARGIVFAMRMLSGQINIFNGIGLANTSLAFINNTLIALAESDLPYALWLMPDGDIETVGRWDLDGKLKKTMTAHPKVDAVTGEAFSFRWSPVRPFLSYFRIGADGKKKPDVPIFSFRRPSFAHDMAITERYAIFPDIQLVMKPQGIVKGVKRLVGYDGGKAARVGVIPRYATDESDMKWIEVPGFNFIHTVNAWDEKGGEVVVLVAANITPVEHMLERMDLLQCRVEMVKINFREGMVVSRKPLSIKNLEWGVINPKFVGRKNRYAYMGIGEPMPKVSSIVKLDFDRADGDDCVVAARMKGEAGGAGKTVRRSRLDKQEKGNE